jgi:hypothetical protein
VVFFLSFRAPGDMWHHLSWSSDSNLEVCGRKRRGWRTFHWFVAAVCLRSDLNRGGVSLGKGGNDIFFFSHYNFFFIQKNFFLHFTHTKKKRKEHEKRRFWGISLKQRGKETENLNKPRTNNFFVIICFVQWKEVEYIFFPACVIKYNLYILPTLAQKKSKVKCMLISITFFLSRPS